MFHTSTGPTGDARAVQDRYSGNVFLLIEQIFAQNMNVINEGTAARYEEEDLANMQYQAQLDNWKKDADALPDAGKGAYVDDQYNMNGTGVGALGGVALAGIAGGLLAAYLGLSAAGFALSASVVGAAIGIALLVAAACVLIAYFVIEKAFTKDTNVHTLVPGYQSYDNTKQTAQQNLIQQDQQAVTRIQQWMNKIMQQYISPANDAKSQDSNMIQGAMQWLKSMVWSQGAA